MKFRHLNLTDWIVGSDGRLDISRAANVSAAASYGKLHEPLNSPNSSGFQLAPNRYNKAHAEATGSYKPNRLGFSLGVVFDRSDFTDTPLIGGGTLVNSDRNEDEYQGFTKLSYDFSPGYSGFVKGTYDSRRFDEFFDRSGQHRASTGYRASAGIDLQLTHLLSGELFVGYLDQAFAKNVPKPLKSVSGIDFGAGLNWYVDPILTIHLNASHQISDVTLGGASASDDKLVRLSADYELRYNVLVQAYASYGNSQFVGQARKDNNYGAGVSVKYLMNRYLSADIGYGFSQRATNIAGIAYSDNLVSVGVGVHL